MSEMLRRRVQERLAALEINPFEAARRAKLERSFVNDLLIGKKSTIREGGIIRLAEALECDPEYLTGAQSRPVRGENPTGLPLAGIVELGAWREDGESAIPETPIPIAPDPRFPPERIKIYLVRGDHAAGLGISDGSVICVLAGETNVREGDILLAERTRGSEKELSIRVLTAGALSARPGKGSIQSIPLGSAQVVGIVVNAQRVFGPQN